MFVVFFCFSPFRFLLRSLCAVMICVVCAFGSLVQFIQLCSSYGAAELDVTPAQRIEIPESGRHFLCSAERSIFSADIDADTAQVAESASRLLPDGRMFTVLWMCSWCFGATALVLVLTRFTCTHTHTHTHTHTYTRARARFSPMLQLLLLRSSTAEHVVVLISSVCLFFCCVPALLHWLICFVVSVRQCIA
jgi:hypothetical protein